LRVIHTVTPASCITYNKNNLIKWADPKSNANESSGLEHLVQGHTAKAKVKDFGSRPRISITANIGQGRGKERGKEKEVRDGSGREETAYFCKEIVTAETDIRYVVN